MGAVGVAVGTGDILPGVEDALPEGEAGAAVPFCLWREERMDIALVER